jgi:hypothetical protein
MTELSDAPSLDRAVETGRPAFLTLLEETLGVEQ